MLWAVLKITRGSYGDLMTGSEIFFGIGDLFSTLDLHELIAPH
jgi:hypothetical protein